MDAGVRARLAELGFSEADAETLADHFLDAEQRGKLGHGLSRVNWLESRPVELDPSASPRRVVREPGYERWDGNAARRPAGARAPGRCAALLPDGNARLLGAEARRGRSGRCAHGNLAAQAWTP